MLHTEYKLSQVEGSGETLNAAARIVAKSCLSGALECHRANDLPVTFEALEEWGWQDIIDAFAGAGLIFDYWLPVGDELRDEVRIAEPFPGTWHDELLIDIDDRDLYEEILSVAAEKLEEYARTQIKGVA